jgi:hypothetical protein
MRNVHKKEFDFLRLPEQAMTEDRGYSFCSEPYLALADVSDSIQWKNDVFGVAGLFDSMTVELERNDATLENALGFAVTMPKQTNATGFVIDWRSNLIAYGPGCYRVKVTWDIQGMTGFYYAGYFELMPYSVTASEGTVQMIVNYDDKVLNEGINYTGSGFYTGLRFKGFFGNEQINSEHRNLLKANNVRVKVRNFSAPSYDLVTRPLTRCFTRPLKQMLLNASDIWVSDYNAWNHEQYRYFNVILSDSQGVEMEGDETFVRQINATLLDKLWTTESKYDQKTAQPPALSELIQTLCPGGIAVNSNASFTLPVPSGGTAPIPDSPINVNGNNEGDVVSVQPINVNLTDGTNPVTPDSVTLVGNDLTIEAPKLWWKRDPNWMQMPNVQAGDNVFYGLYAVIEDDFNTLGIFKNGTASFIDWGDGTTETSTGTTQHAYNYATLTSPIHQLFDGRNYKQVIVRIDIPTDATLFAPTSETTLTTVSRNVRAVQNWLDMVMDATNTSNLTFRPSVSTTDKAKYLERIKSFSQLVTVTNAITETVRLRVLDTQMYGSSIAGAFAYSGDFRADELGTPNDIVSTSSTSVSLTFLSSRISKLGQIQINSVTDTQRLFQAAANLEEVGVIEMFNGTTMLNFAQNCFSLQKIGPIFTSSALQTLATAFQNNFSLRELVFNGTLSGVNNVTNTLQNCYSLERLITPDLTRGLDVRATQLTGTNLQDWFTSLGTAAGSQTITLPAFTIGEPTTIATTKGYIIAYA